MTLNLCWVQGHLCCGPGGRLNRGGDRQLNRALHTIVMIRETWHEPTKGYVARRTAEGKGRREIRRCLTRATARQLFRLLERQPPPAR
jgi:transposase